MAMTEFQKRAENIATAIGASTHRIESYGYADDPAAESVSRIYGMFITWLTACEETRLGDSYSKSVIASLPDKDDANWATFIEPAPTSTLKERAAALWGVRVAFTHGDGDTALITHATNKAYAANAPLHLPGVKLIGTQLVLDRNVVHHAIQTIAQLQSVLP